MAIDLYRFEHVTKQYSGPGESLTVLDNISLSIRPGERIAIVGQSGAGKSTFLHLLGTLDTPTRGDLFFEGRNVRSLSPDQKAGLRNKSIGFVFQFHHLLPEFSSLENVAMPAIIGGTDKDQAFAMAHEAMKAVNLWGKEKQGVTTLSGGERQRVAIARAILNKPSVLLADEPTGSLDEKTGAGVSRLLLDLNHERGMALIVVTHNREIADLMARRLEIRSGELYDQTG